MNNIKLSSDDLKTIMEKMNRLEDLLKTIESAVWFEEKLVEEAEKNLNEMKKNAIKKSLVNMVRFSDDTFKYVETNWYDKRMKKSYGSRVLENALRRL
ncbi:Hypothetical protein SRAE_0000069100 [Strongyloides ratti]|uniref:Uncharacterized protein n=1 Tax=Strongyloides ratti TaxID=34506 RepID=A0A090MTC4_STRRB|nr:Hypothetical protein SRAE_0000069100 [Strongyloides ratti]CEF61573.1 Hypothetical protein SRAE_0000069100 [Strongyloides ratti]